MDVDATGLEPSAAHRVTGGDKNTSTGSAECNNNSSSSSVDRPGKGRPRPPVPQKPEVAPKPAIPGSSPSHDAKPACSGPKAPPKIRPRTSLPRPPSPPPKPPPSPATSPHGRHGVEGGTEPLTGEGEADQGERSLKTRLSGGEGSEGVSNQQNGEGDSGLESTCKESESNASSKCLPQYDLEEDSTSPRNTLAAGVCKNGDASPRLPGELAPKSSSSLPRSCSSPRESTVSSGTRSPPATLPKSKPSPGSSAPRSPGSSSEGFVHARPMKSPPQTLPKPTTSPNRSSGVEDDVFQDTSLKSPPCTLPKPRVYSQAENRKAASSVPCDTETLCTTADSAEACKDSKLEVASMSNDEVTAGSSSNCAKSTTPSVFPEETRTCAGMHTSDGPSAANVALNGDEEPKTPNAVDRAKDGCHTPSQPPKPLRPSKLPPKRPDKSPSLRQTLSQRTESETSQVSGLTSPQIPTGPTDEDGTGHDCSSPRVKTSNKAERTGSLGRGTKPSVKPPAPPPSKPPPPPPKNPPATSPKTPSADQVPPSAVPYVSKPLPPVPKNLPVSSQSPPSQSSTAPHNSSVAAVSLCSKTLPQAQEASVAESVEKSAAQAAPCGTAPVPSKPLPPIPPSPASQSPRPSASPSLPSSKFSTAGDTFCSSPPSSESVTAQPSCSISQDPPPLPSKPPAGLPAMVGGKPVSDHKTTPDSQTTPKAPARKVTRSKSKNLPPPPPPPTAKSVTEPSEKSSTDSSTNSSKKSTEKSSSVWHVKDEAGHLEENEGKSKSEFYVSDEQEASESGGNDKDTTEMKDGNSESSTIEVKEKGGSFDRSSETVPPSSSQRAHVSDLKPVLEAAVSSQEHPETLATHQAASQKSSTPASSSKDESSVSDQTHENASSCKRPQKPPPRPAPRRRSLPSQKAEAELAESSKPAHAESSSLTNDEKHSNGSENVESLQNEDDVGEDLTSAAKAGNSQEAAALPDDGEPANTCDMLKEIEEMLKARLVDTEDGDSNQSIVLSESSLSHQVSGSLAGSEDSLSRGDQDDANSSTSSPRRPPRPKREASKKRASFSAFDTRTESDSDHSSGGTMPRKPHPPKPERKSLTRVGRSQSDVSGMKSVVDKEEEERMEGKKPYLPPRKESLGYGERGPPPLPPRNTPTGNSVTGSDGSPSLSRADPGRGGSLRACPPGKPPRTSLHRPARPAPATPPTQTSKRLSAQYKRIQTELDSEPGIWGRIVSNDHDYHEIEYHEISDTMVVPVVAGKTEAGAKESTPPPNLPPRTYCLSMPSQGGSRPGSEEGEESSRGDYHDMSGSSPSTGSRPVSNVSQQSSQSTGSGSGASGHGGGIGEDSSGSDDEPDSEEAQKRKKEKKVFNIVREIASSEQVFVDVLKLLNIDFRLAVSKATEALGRNVIPTEMLNKILDYLPQLQNFNEDLLHDLNERVKNWESHPQIADIFAKKGPFLKLYSSYIRNFENASALLDEACKKYPAFQSAVKDFEASPRCASLAVHHYMLKPIQRIPQYRLLLQEYCKHITQDSPDYKNTVTALNIVNEVADHANESMRQGDKLKKLMDIQHSLIGQFEVIQPGRVFIKDGELKKLSRKEMQPRMFFLFSDVLLYTTMLPTGYRINNILPLTGMKVSKSSQMEDFRNEFSIISVQRSFTLAAETPGERDAWIDALNKAIKEMTERRHTFEMSRAGPQTSLLDNDFVVGEKAPIWVPDARVTMCMLCLSEFTITWRRHHCRGCGRVVCANCSENEAPLRYLKYKTARVCDECYETLHRAMQEKEKSGAEAVEEAGVEDSKPVNINNILGRFQRFRRSSNVRRSATFRPAVLKEVKANDEGSAMSGYLKMYRNKKWKQLWFVVKDKVLYVYKASEDMAAIESIPLLGYEIDRATHEEVTETTKYFEKAEPDLIFTLSHSNMPKLVFRTDSAAATNRWINVMREASVA